MPLASPPAWRGLASSFTTTQATTAMTSRRPWAQMGEAVDIVLVDWPFPYGPVRIHRNSFCQTGAQNHYLLRFGSADAWCLNLDIDEWPGGKRGKDDQTIFARLRRQRRRRGVVRLVYGPIASGTTGDSESTYQLVLVPESQTSRAATSNFAFKPRHIEYVKPHIAYPKNRVFAMLIGLPRFIRQDSPIFLRKRSKSIFQTNCSLFLS